MLALGGCMPKRVTQPVTIAFPNPNIRTASGIAQFLEILKTDARPMVYDTHVEGLPVEVVQIEMDAMRMRAMGIVVADVSSAINAGRLKPFETLPSADSLLILLRSDDLQRSMAVDELGRLIVGRPGRETAVQLRDFAEISAQLSTNSLTINGQACSVIKGTTEATQKELEEYLMGLESRLDLKFFIILGE